MKGVLIDYTSFQAYRAARRYRAIAAREDDPVFKGKLFKMAERQRRRAGTRTAQVNGGGALAGSATSRG